jgi:Replication-relaxation
VRLTLRDIRLVRDIALSHVVSRDQILALGYFGSVTRLNTRLRELEAEGYVRVLETMFSSQFLYMAGSKAGHIVGTRIASLLLGRKPSPQFVQHALSVTNVRIALATSKGLEWRFEQQLRHSFTFQGKRYEIRPDGMIASATPLFLEVDLGHVSPSRFQEKLNAFDAFARSGVAEKILGNPQFRLLTITSGSLRSRRLTKLMPAGAGFEFLCHTFQELSIPSIESWS